ncbi:uncharacterized protein LOC135195276 [Macrobrachium nipponense]|uniref:uncharacterized protein LOC135195276 n=1 Tax=Macrobrachium nipponense TaxID=159736 RepID=UPI0030C81AF4
MSLPPVSRPSKYLWASPGPFPGHMASLTLFPGHGEALPPVQRHLASLALPFPGHQARIPHLSRDTSRVSPASSRSTWQTSPTGPEKPGEPHLPTMPGTCSRPRPRVPRHLVSLTCPPVPGNMAGLARPSQDTCRASPAMCPGKPAEPRPPRVPGHQANLARYRSRDTSRVSPAHSQGAGDPRTPLLRNLSQDTWRPRPPVPGHLPSLTAICPRTPAEPRPPRDPGCLAELARPPRDTWRVPPAHPGTPGGPHPPAPGCMAGLACLSRDTWRASPARPRTPAEPRPPRVPGRLAELARPPRNAWQGPTCPSRDAFTDLTRPPQDAWRASLAHPRAPGEPRPLLRSRDSFWSFTVSSTNDDIRKGIIAHFAPDGVDVDFKLLEEKKSTKTVVDDDFKWFKSQGKISTLENWQEGHNVNVLRDTGSSQSLILRKAIPGGNIVASESKFAVVDTLPIPEVDVVLANDLAQGPPNFELPFSLAVDASDQGQVTVRRRRETRVHPGRLVANSRAPKPPREPRLRLPHARSGTHGDLSHPPQDAMAGLAHPSRDTWRASPTHPRTPARDTWRTSPARPRMPGGPCPATCPETPAESRQAQCREPRWNSPARPGTPGGSHLPVPGRMADLTRPPQDTCRALPTRPRTPGGPRPPVPGHLAGLAHLSWDTWQASPARPGMRGGSHPPVPGCLAGLPRPSRDAWWASPMHPLTPGGSPPPVPGHLAGLPCPSQDAWWASPARPVTPGGPRPRVPGCLEGLASPSRDACP